MMHIIQYLHILRYFNKYQDTLLLENSLHRTINKSGRLTIDVIDTNYAVCEA